MSAESVMVRSLDELVTPADLIARVTVVSDNIDRTWTWQTGYRRVAFARVLDPIRGTVRDQIVRLYHDNGNSCPNVRYQRGDDVLIFATRIHHGYQAIWFQTGVMNVTRSMVRHDLYPQGRAYQDVRTRIRASRAPKRCGRTGSRGCR